MITILNVVRTIEHNPKETRKSFNGITRVTSDGIAPRVLTAAKGTELNAKIRVKLTITVCYVHGDAHKVIETKAVGLGKVESAPIVEDGIEIREPTYEPKGVGAT